MDETEERLLDAVLADPDADAPRLAYADYREKLGDADRAEFIRASLTVARMKKEGRPRQDVSDASLLADGLLMKHGEDWRRPIAQMTGKCSFHRGFIEECTLSASAFCHFAEKIRLFAPVRHWCLVEAKGWRADILQVPELQSSISLIINHAGLNHVDAAIISLCPLLAGLRRLDLCDNQITEAGASALVHSPVLRNLKELNLRGNPFDPNIISELNYDLAVTHQYLSADGEELEKRAGRIDALHYDEIGNIKSDWFDP